MEWKNETGARNEIKSLVERYYRDFKKESSFVPWETSINYSGRIFDEKEMCSLTDALLDFWLTAGRYAEEFEKKLASYIGVKFAHLVNSGSSANLVAFSALTSPQLGERRIQKGDEVICVACAFPTTVAPIVQNGAVPVFMDVTIPQYNIDVTLLEEAVSDRTKAVFIAHTLGNPFDIGGVKAFCERHQLWLIEDNCDALGSEYTIKNETRKTGAWGDISTCSFYPPHHITMGEGGAVCTDNPLLSRIILSYRDWGRDCICSPGTDNYCGHRFDGEYGKLPSGYDHKYIYSNLGYNLKATDMQAAIGCAQIEKLPGFVETRKKNWGYLRDALSDFSDVLVLPELCSNSDPSWFGFLITMRGNAKTSRNEMIRYLESKGIQTRLLFAGNITRQPCFDRLDEGKDYRIVGSLENTDRIMNDSFWVGVYPGLDETRLEYMVEMIRKAIRQA